MMNASRLIAVGRPRGWGNLVIRTATLVGLRDGLQIEGPVSTEQKVRFLESILTTGVPRVRANRVCLGGSAANDGRRWTDRGARG